MNNNDLNDMLKKAQEMINNNQVPDEIKDLASKLKSDGVDSSKVNADSSNSSFNSGSVVNGMPSDSSSSNSNYNESSTGNNNVNKFDFSNIDIGTLMKVQGMLSKLNSASDDDMTKLLFALKPYLRNEKKEKVDEYVKLVRMGKMTELFDLLK